VICLSNDFATISVVSGQETTTSTKWAVAPPGAIEATSRKGRNPDRLYRWVRLDSLGFNAVFHCELNWST